VIEAVIFDWGGTLSPWATVDHLASWRAYADELHPGDTVAAERAAAALLAAEQTRWTLAKETHRAFTLAHVLADAQVATHDLGLAAYQRYWVHATYTDPEAAPMLAELKRYGLALGVLSSTGWPAAWHEEFLHRDGVLELFDGCVWSSDLEWTKPHPAAFEAAMTVLGVRNPTRCVFVGDRPYDDISGAKAVGMRAVLVPHSDIPEHQQVPVEVSPDAVIQRLADLPGVLADW